MSAEAPTTLRKPNWFSRLANPGEFLRWSQPIVAPLGFVTIVFFAVGLYYAFLNSPADYQIIPTVVRPALRSALAGDSGWVTRRPVAAGEPLVEPAVGPPALVTAGQAVTFVAEQAGIRLAIRGTAATGGALGDHVWIRMESGRRLRGTITAPATVHADSTALR